MINITIAGDIIQVPATAFADVIGDQYFVAHQFEVIDPVALHEMALYYELATYLDDSGKSAFFDENQRNELTQLRELGNGR
jgi:hypothetical protein